MESEAIIIDDYALIACSCTILPGVHMPEGMAIGAHTLVKKGKYQAWSLYAGIPCRYLGERDSEVYLDAVKSL